MITVLEHQPSEPNNCYTMYSDHYVAQVAEEMDQQVGVGSGGSIVPVYYSSSSNSSSNADTTTLLSASTDTAAPDSSDLYTTFRATELTAVSTVTTSGSTNSEDTMVMFSM